MASSRSSRRARSIRPEFDSLENRELLAHLVNHGGALLTHVQVESVFWGATWANPQQLGPVKQQLDKYLGWITNSTYMDMLSQYNVGRGKFIGSQVMSSLATPPNVDDSQIRRVLDKAISQGSIAPPTSNRLYMVYMPPNMVVTAGSHSSVHDFLGYHWSFQDSAGQTVYYAIIANPSGGTSAVRGLDSFQQLTVVTSHELAEAVTDPGYPKAWNDDNYGSQGEVGDLAVGTYGNVSGYVVQAEWSNADNKPIFPRQSQTVPPSAWTPSGGYLSSIVAGYGGVFGLDGSNQVWAYDDSKGWTATGGYGQDLSVGSDIYGRNELWVRAGDGSIWRYDSGQWAATGGYLSSIVAGSGEVVGLDGSNQVWVFNDSTGWVSTGGYAQSISLGADVHGRDELWVRAGDGSVWRYQGGQWSNSGGYLSSIVAGFGGEVFGLDASNQVWVFNDSVGWVATGGYGKSLSVGIDGIAHDELWVVAVDNGIWRYSYGQWSSTNGYLNSVVAGYRGFFGLDGRNQVWAYNDSKGWMATGGYGQDLTVGTDGLGHNELWLRAGDSSVWRYDAPRAQGAVAASPAVASRVESSLKAASVALAGQPPDGLVLVLDPISPATASADATRDPSIRHKTSGRFGNLVR